MPEQNDSAMQDLKPTVWIGKQGSSETMIEEIVAQLKKRKLIKVKWLQSAEVDPKEVAMRAKARLVEVRGRTMVLAEKGKSSTTAGPAKSAPATPVKLSARAKGRSEAVKSAPAREGARKPIPEKSTVRKPRQIGTMKPRKRSL